MEEYGVNSEFKENDSQESQKVSPPMETGTGNENRSRERQPTRSEQCLFLRGDSRSRLPAEQTPGSINEGGELGYSLAHAYVAALDNRAPPEVYFNRN